MDLDKKAKLHNPQALFNLIRIIQEYLITKSKLFIFVFLPFDIIFSISLLISYTERIIAYKLVNQFLLYIKYDLLYVREISRMIIKTDYVSKTLTEPIDEKEFSGTIYRHIQKTIKFIWSLIILIILFPILPILWVYDFLASKVLIGTLYYTVIFIDTHIIITILLFLVATFLVASSTVPFLFKVFVYIKYLFELKRKPYEEIKSDAETFFMRLYNYKHTDIDHNDLINENEVEGGLYYLFLKLVHTIKDHLIYFFSTRLKKIDANKNTKQVIQKIDEIKNKIVDKVNARKEIKLNLLIGPLIAFIFTFAFAGFLVFGNSQGKGIIGSFVLSVVSKNSSYIIWTNYQNTSTGFFSYSLTKIPLGFMKAVGSILDIILRYFFVLWHNFYPIYISFIFNYYKFLFRIIGVRV